MTIIVGLITDSVFNSSDVLLLKRQKLDIKKIPITGISNFTCLLSVRGINSTERGVSIIAEKGTASYRVTIVNRIRTTSRSVFVVKQIKSRGLLLIGHIFKEGVGNVQLGWLEVLIFIVCFISNRLIIQLVDILL